MSSPILLQLNSQGLSAADQLRRLSDRNQALEQALAELNEEVALLTAERDELLDALRDWSRTTPDERMELLMDHELAQLRHELAVLKGEQRPVRQTRTAPRRTGQGRRCA